MTTANKLTIMRIALIPVFLVVLYLDFAGARWWALGIFIVACLTDFADGYIARHYNQITNFGKFMDPLADKMLVMAAMCARCCARAGARKRSPLSAAATRNPWISTERFTFPQIVISWQASSSMSA